MYVAIYVAILAVNVKLARQPGEKRLELTPSALIMTKPTSESAACHKIRNEFFVNALQTGI